MSRADPEFLVITNRQRRLRVPRQRITTAVHAAFRDFSDRRRPVSVVVVNDREMRRLHRDYLGKDSATDVLSFPLEADEGPGDGLFGEVIVSADTALREARRRGHPPTFELTLYCVHGVLHLLGLDDHEAADRRAMRRAEQRCLKAAGISRPLFADRPEKSSRLLNRTD